MQNDEYIKIPQPSISPSQSNSPAAQGFDMFSALDNSASSPNSQSAFSNSSSTSLSDSDLNSLKLKVEDLEFKLERLLEKLSVLESNLNHA